MDFPRVLFENIFGKKTSNWWVMALLQLSSPEKTLNLLSFCIWAFCNPSRSNKTQMDWLSLFFFWCHTFACKWTCRNVACCTGRYHSKNQKVIRNKITSKILKIFTWHLQVTHLYSPRESINGWYLLPLIYGFLAFIGFLQPPSDKILTAMSSFFVWVLTFSCSSTKSSENGSLMSKVFLLPHFSVLVNRMHLIWYCWWWQ